MNKVIVGFEEKPDRSAKKIEILKPVMNRFERYVDFIKSDERYKHYTANEIRSITLEHALNSLLDEVEKYNPDFVNHCAKKRKRKSSSSNVTVNETKENNVEDEQENSSETNQNNVNQ